MRNRRQAPSAAMARRWRAMATTRSARTAWQAATDFRDPVDRVGRGAGGPIRSPSEFLFTPRIAAKEMPWKSLSPPRPCSSRASAPSSRMRASRDLYCRTLAIPFREEHGGYLHTERTARR